MGGRTWENKEAILKALYEGWLSGKYPTGRELAVLIGRHLSTVSTHLAELRELGYVEEKASRKCWRLTAKGHAYLRSIAPAQRTLELRGVIAAGPALPLGDTQAEPLPDEGFNPDTYFALRVRGTSMVGEGIQHNAIVICKSVSTWLDVPLGAIVVARVPEGTGEEGPDWLENLLEVSYREGMSLPRLDHVTLKKLDVVFRSYLQGGEEYHRADIQLRGTGMSFRALAIAIDGYVVESRNRHV